jgi:hypothetical protein
VSAGPTVSAGVSTDAGASTTATSSQANTRISEAFWLDTKRVERDYRVVVEVDEVPPSIGAPGRRSQRTAARQAAPPVRTEATGRMTLLVPSSVIDSAPPKPLSGAVDHRPISLPADYIVEGTQAYRTGDEPVNTLFAAVYRRLGQSDMLTEAGVRMHRTALENMLGASARMSAFHEIAGAGGHELIPLPVPGHSAREIAVRVRADISGLELISDPDDESTVQLGSNSRELRISQLTTESNRLLPTSQTVGVNDPLTGLSGGASGGEQATEAGTGTVGARHETGAYESGRVVTVKVNVDYHLDLERRRIDRHNRPRVERADTIKHAATGEAYLTMFRHEYDAMRERMEAGRPPLEGWDPSKAPKPERVETVELNISAHRPYRQMMDALARARREGVNIQLTLHDQDGPGPVYVAAPDGTMTAKTPQDDGFARAFATLHPRLALLPEGLFDLRDLYDSGVPHERFTRVVVDALETRGIPASAMVELDSTLRRPAQQATGTAGDRQRTAAPGMSGAGMTIE